MASCARCGADAEKTQVGRYDYCQNCDELLTKVMKEEVSIQYLQNNTNWNAAGYYVTPPGGETVPASSQVDALAKAKDFMDQYGCRGVFKYRENRSRWLIDEYLEQHPSIANDVDKKRSGILKSLVTSLKSSI